MVVWRRERESNPRIKVLQTSALPLGYHALERRGERHTAMEMTFARLTPSGSN